MAEIIIGTSGYYYDEWVGPVYPEGTKKKDYLACYSELFPTVELNFSYYQKPEAAKLAKMLSDGGPNLTFSIKAHQTLTHEIEAHKWEGEATEYLKAIEPLLEAKRLEAVLFEFPYKFHYTPENRKYLDRLLTYFQGVPVAVEFRTVDWYTEKVIETMKSRNVSLVSLDMPDLPKLPPSMDVVTSPLAYIRLHGRNKEAWWGKDGHARYDYLYADSEVEAWVGRIKRITEQAQRILVYFNNHPNGKAARNAQTLEKMLRKIGLITDREGREMNNGGKSSLPS
ncbi:MAG: DUF72 domain-containing protein [Treponema sp.]|jgi:uncharacterized protein YecE (DUF72 family)|nr:DUF72 domain-containing protein [Treponema sp.]